MHRSPIFSTDLRWIFCSKEKTLYFCTDRVHHASCLAQRTRVELLFYTGMKYSKQPLTIEQQTSLLKDRGLSIGDEAAARKILDTISYFRLANCLDKQYCRSRQQTIHTAMLHSLPVEQYPSRKYIHANVERTDCCLFQRGCHSDGVPTRLGNRIFMAVNDSSCPMPY